MAVKIDSVSARDKLKVRREPYWHRVAKGSYLGYRKMVTGPGGSWVARMLDEGTKQSYHSLGDFSGTYNAEACFETFPFPLAGVHDLEITAAAIEFHSLRYAWLNPPEWTDCVGEVIPVGMETSPFPDRVVPKRGFEQQLKARTLTDLYNDNPAWFRQLRERLDIAVAMAFEWNDYSTAMSDDEILIRLMALNHERSQAPI